MNKPFLSILIPAYNEAHRLPKTLILIDEFLNNQPFISEIIVIENCSSDGTFEIAQNLKNEIRNLVVLHEDERGKGCAIKKGMLTATGKYRLICDTDLSTPIEEVLLFLPPILNNADVAIASRELPGSKRYNEPLYRHLIGRIFNWFVQMILLQGLHDTQCGFKCFREDVADKIFPLVTISGWTFDVEALHIARLFGYEIIEIPISWYYEKGSKIRVVRDSLKMAYDLVKIKINAISGKYFA